jgi:hypothetical protein
MMIFSTFAFLAIGFSAAGALWLYSFTGRKQAALFGKRIVAMEWVFGSALIALGGFFAFGVTQTWL